MWQEISFDDVEPIDRINKKFYKIYILKIAISMEYVAEKSCVTSWLFFLCLVYKSFVPNDVDICVYGGKNLIQVKILIQVILKLNLTKLIFW